MCYPCMAFLIFISRGPSAAAPNSQRHSYKSNDNSALTQQDTGRRWPSGEGTRNLPQYSEYRLERSSNCRVATSACGKNQ
mmetsp:Transcript_12926/g.36870  ORF Transcript_12926/g.36870 Transcript_12926/m.36870 type:complete len:80 (-) Transcript_12926:93-332(-)